MARRLLPMIGVRLFSILILTFGLAACGGDDGGTNAPDASTDTPDAATGTLAYMTTCEPTDDQCDRSENPEIVCFPFNNKGPHCTHPCDVDTDCAAPSLGCGGQGVCRPPD